MRRLALAPQILEAWRETAALAHHSFWLSRRAGHQPQSGQAGQILKVVNIDQIFGEEVCMLLAQAASVISMAKWKYAMRTTAMRDDD
jgi:hypothetical protein